MARPSGMRLENNTVFVLGAGFTKAFLPNAPLLVDDYDVPSILLEFDGFPTARAVLENEIDNLNPHRVNFERLMTRTSAGMPYDSDVGSSEELSLLFSRLKQALESRLQSAREGPVYKDDLVALASLCVDRRITCITFNYDALLDEALWKTKSVINVLDEESYWHPDGGYGFFCPPAWALPGFGGQNVVMDSTVMSLFKLHGSVNWRIRLGYTSPLSLDAVVHLEKWLPHGYRRGNDLDEAELTRYLEPGPFVVPPILTKDTLLDEPVLRLVWSRAFQALQQAELVVFIGYSFPLTDIAARFLFTEAIRPETRLRVVNCARTKTSQAALRARYREALGTEYHQFTFGDALEWSRALVGKYGEKPIG